uniref:Ribosomal protein S14 n=1 Tax=Acrasis kona TaxID=1008807 RepID=A0A0B4MZ04_9EUKA|nr:ribosomal protein S14 [Acrasis kona]AID52050.1 ribosomal protein S14 [Acrasis kona]
MGKRNKINKQCKVRYIFEKWNKNKYIKNIIDLDPYLPKELNINNKINNIKNGSISRTHPVCLFSGRSKANFNKYKMSRMMFKKYGENGYLNGLKKSSW